MRAMQIIFLRGVSEACSGGFTAAYIRSGRSLLPAGRTDPIGRVAERRNAGFDSGLIWARFGFIQIAFVNG